MALPGAFRSTEVVHVVLVVRNSATVVLRLVDLLLDPCFDRLHNIRALVDQVNSVNIHDCNATHRRVPTHKQQWLAYKRSDTSNSEVDSPVIATFNAQVFARLDKLSNGSAGSEVRIAQNLLPVGGALGQRCLSCTCVNPNLDPLKFVWNSRVSGDAGGHGEVCRLSEQRAGGDRAK